MHHRPGVIHESVANVMSDMGMANRKTTNPANNSRPVTEDSEAEKSAKLVKEEAEKAAKLLAEANGDDTNTDETDGEADDSTTTDTGTSAKCNTDSSTTDPKVDVSAAKKGAKKKTEEGEEAEGDKLTEVELAEAVQASEAFYENLDHPISIVIWEGEDGKEEVEVHGLTEADLAPCGGTAPAISPKYSKAAKDGGSVTKGSAGELMLYSTQEMNVKVAKLLSGRALRACGYKAPGKGKGKGTIVIGGK